MSPLYAVILFEKNIAISFDSKSDLSISLNRMFSVWDYSMYVIRLMLRYVNNGILLMCCTIVFEARHFKLSDCNELV